MYIYNTRIVEKMKPMNVVIKIILAEMTGPKMYIFSCIYIYIYLEYVIIK